MKMAKPSAQDIQAAEELMQLLQLIDARFGGPWANPDAGESLNELLKDGEEEFDCDDTTHLQTLYNNLACLLRNAPAFYGRVISGMCHVIMNEKNEILDPDSDTIDLHPRFAELDSAQRDTRRLDFMLDGHRKLVIERIPSNAILDRLSIYVEEGFLGDRRYPAVAFYGDWKGEPAKAEEAKRKAIDAAFAEWVLKP